MERRARMPSNNTHLTSDSNRFIVTCAEITVPLVELPPIKKLQYKKTQAVFFFKCQKLMFCKLTVTLDQEDVHQSLIPLEMDILIAAPTFLPPPPSQKRGV